MQKCLYRSGFTQTLTPVYYEVLAPLQATGRPSVVMLHGGSHTGSCYHVTAAGNPGWAYRFVNRGYTVATPDWPGHGRSGGLDLSKLSGETVAQGIAAVIATLPGPVVLLTHSMGGALGWRVAELSIEKLVAIIGVAPGPPGNIQPMPEILSETEDEIVMRTPRRTIHLKHQGPVCQNAAFVENKLVGASKRFPREQLAVYSRMLTPTASRLLYERQNPHNSQVFVHEPARFAGMPVLVITGSEDLDHPRELDNSIAEWFSAHQAKAEFIWLEDRGIAGNGHMLMMEDNSDDVADVILDWLDGQITPA